MNIFPVGKEFKFKKNPLQILKAQVGSLVRPNHLHYVLMIERVKEKWKNWKNLENR